MKIIHATVNKIIHATVDKDHSATVNKDYSATVNKDHSATVNKDHSCYLLIKIFIIRHINDESPSRKVSLACFFCIEMWETLSPVKSISFGGGDLCDI